MRIKTFFAACTLVLALGGADVAAQSSIHNPMTQAVLSVYEDELQRNPNNFEVLINRAEEYFRHEEYIRALEDVNRALTCIPAAQTQYKLHAYLLRAGIYNRSGHPSDALSDLVEAEKLAPQSISVLLQKGNTEIETGALAAAKLDFQRAQRLNTRNAEAYIGLAKVAVLENNMGTANDLLESAVNIDPNNADTYLRRSAVRKSMANHNGAVEDLILALSVDPDNQLAMAAIVDYGNTNYPATMAGLSSAVTAAPQVGMYRYIRAGIAQAHFNYLAALEDYQTIVRERIYDYHGIYASIANCQFALCKYDDALNNIDHALASVTDGNTSKYFTLRSRILRALGRNEEAVRVANNAVAADRNSGDALAELALAYVAVGNYTEASSLLAEASVNDADSPRYPLLRGWVMEKYLNDADGARNQYRKVAEMEQYFADDINSLKGFALLFLGENEKAERWMENILNTVTDYDGLINYYATCFYGILNNSDKAFECARKSLDLGYGNYFDWTENNDGLINIGLLRDDLRFLRIIASHNSIFGL